MLAKPHIDAVADNMAYDIPDDEESASANYSESDSELAPLLQLLKIDIKHHTTEIADIKASNPDIENTEIVQLLIAQIHSNKKMEKSIVDKNSKAGTNVIKPNQWHKLDHNDLRYLLSQSDTTSDMHKKMKEASLIAKLV